jgi:hypothetical protein
MAAAKCGKPENVGESSWLAMAVAMKMKTAHESVAGSLA